MIKYKDTLNFKHSEKQGVESLSIFTFGTRFAMSSQLVCTVYVMYVYVPWLQVRPASDRQRPHCLELYASGGADLIKACKTDSEGKVVEGKHTVYR